MQRLLITFLVSLAAMGSSAQQPNILLVIADDLGIDPVPNYLPGPQKAAMPNLQALMASGLTFDNVWVNPLCSPTRATMITGRYGLYTGVLDPGTNSLLPPDALTLHRYLDDIGSGYASALIGKWHLGGTLPSPTYPNTMGIPHFAGLLTGAVADYNSWMLTVNGVQSPSTDYITTRITDLAIDWIGQQEQPWFCWVAYNAPHTPFHLPPPDMHTQGDLPTDQATIAANPLPYYLAMVESVDHELGRLLAALPEDELANTIVILIGDNGTTGDVIQSPYQPNRAKGTLYEGGVHVPLVIAGPGVTRSGEREAALVNSSDLFATVVELGGNALPTYQDSRSLLPMLSEAQQTVRECLYAEVIANNGGHAIRNERYKLISFSNGNQRFHDLLMDPWESVNLLGGGLTPDEQAALDALEANCSIVSAVPRQQLSEIEFMPNPVVDQLMIAGLPSGIGHYVIRSMTGAVVLQGVLSGPLGSIAVTDLASGVYVVQVADRSRRFIKE